MLDIITCNFMPMILKYVQGSLAISNFDRVIMGGRVGEFFNGRRQDEITTYEFRHYKGRTKNLELV